MQQNDVFDEQQAIGIALCARVRDIEFYVKVELDRNAVEVVAEKYARVCNLAGQAGPSWHVPGRGGLVALALVGCGIDVLLWDAAGTNSH